MLLLHNVVRLTGDLHTRQSCKRRRAFATVRHQQRQSTVAAFRHGRLVAAIDAVAGRVATATAPVDHTQPRHAAVHRDVVEVARAAGGRQIVGQLPPVDGVVFGVVLRVRRRRRAGVVSMLVSGVDAIEVRAVVGRRRLVVGRIAPQNCAHRVHEAVQRARGHQQRFVGGQFGGPLRRRRQRCCGEANSVAVRFELVVRPDEGWIQAARRARRDWRRHVVRPAVHEIWLRAEMGGGFENIIKGIQLVGELVESRVWISIQLDISICAEAVCGFGAD